MTLPSDKTALVAEITAAFDGVAREDGVTLHQARVLDDYGGLEEQAIARAKDTDTCWQEVPDNAIASLDAVLSFLDPKGFRYYLPAYLVWYLRNMEPGDPYYESDTFESVLYHLGLDFEGVFREYHLSRFRLFSEVQCKAIAHFLRFLAERERTQQIALDAEFQRILSGEVPLPDDYQFDTWTDDRPQKCLDAYWEQFL